MEKLGLVEVRPHWGGWEWGFSPIFGVLREKRGFLESPRPQHPLGRAVVGNGEAGAAQGTRESRAKVVLPALSKWIPKEPLILEARRDNEDNPERSKKPGRGERSSHGMRGTDWIPSLFTANLAQQRFGVKKPHLGAVPSTG